MDNNTQQKLTASLEDYLEIIYNHITQKNAVKAIEIAKELNVSRASVTEALKRLEKEGFINYGRYGSIAITDLGINKAKEIAQKHKLLEKFFFDILKLDSTEATKNACKIEHVISPKAFFQLEKFIEFNEKNNVLKDFK